MARFSPSELVPVVSVPAANPRIVPVVIISPVRDEAQYLRLTLDAVVSQTCRPTEWILVDDGSRDETPEIIAEYAARYPFIKLIARQDRGFRKLGGGVIAAFEFGRERISFTDWQYIVKLDGDMSFGPLYLEHMLALLEAQPRLAAVSGKVFRAEDGRFIEESHGREQVAGQFKLYKREAFEDIGGFVQHLAWDGIDVHTAAMKGWETLSTYDREAWLWHHRVMGSSDRDLFVGRMRWGRGNWYLGYHPLYAVVAGLNRMREKPYVIGGLLMIVGYFWAAIKRLPRYDNPEFQRHLRGWQNGRLKDAITGRLRERDSS